MIEKYNLCVIGGGPSGYAAAMRAVDFEKSVLLVERDRIGGAGIFDGALSSKTFWEISKEFASFCKKMRHYGLSEPNVNFNNVLQEVNDAVLERSNQLNEHLQKIIHQRPDHFYYLKGNASLLNKNEIEVKTDNGCQKVIAENIIIATGSRPRKIDTIPFDEEIIMTSDGISSLKEFPESLVILGAGVIGCEFATIFSNFGKTNVHLISKDERILPFEDVDMALAIEKNLEANGVLIHRSSKLDKMEIVDGQVEYLIEHPDGERESFHAEKALVSVGRIPNIENTGLLEIGVELSKSGHIIDNDTQTSCSNIYAVGDITADIALVNVGELEGRHAVEKIFGEPKRPIIYKNISTIMFLNPEVAGVGMNEQQAQKSGINYRVAIFDFRCIPRAVAMRNTEGFFKILVTDDEKMQVLGMRAVGEHASSAIQAVALLIATNKGIEELAELIHPHPSIIEGIQECIRVLLGKSIYKPDIFVDYLVYRCFRNGEFVE